MRLMKPANTDSFKKLKFIPTVLYNCPRDLVHLLLLESQIPTYFRPKTG